MLRQAETPEAAGGADRTGESRGKRELGISTRLIPLWSELTRVYCETDVPFPALRLVTLAQWAVESNWAMSDLAKRYNNFAGLKYRRRRMFLYARPVRYSARSDGPQVYCRFRDVRSFVRGYWAFIDNGPYRGWRDHGHDPMGFVNHLKGCGYAEDAQYIETVTRVYRRFLDELRRRPPDLDDVHTDILLRGN